MPENSMTTFEKPTAIAGHIRLRIRERGAGGTLCAYLRGIPLGAPVEVETAASHVDLPVERLPHVALPAEIRIAWSDGSDACSSLVLNSEAVAASLTGPGDLSDLEVLFANGQVRGTARNGVNGISTPLLLGRINGALLRPVRTEVTGDSPEGGARIAFDMPVDATDFTAEGGVIELLVAPSMKTLWRHALGPVGDERHEAVKLLRQATAIEHNVRTAVADVEARLGQKIALQDQLMEDVATYLLALIHDRAAKADQAADADRQLARELIARAARQQESARPARVTVVGVSSPFMGQGWGEAGLTQHRLEVRRLSTAATLLNPFPNRPVRKVTITVVEGDESAIGQLGALMDDEGATVTFSPVRAAPCTLTLTPPDTQADHGFGVLTLVNSSGQGTIAIQDVRFHYADVL